MKSAASFTYILLVTVFMISGCGDEPQNDITARIDSVLVSDTSATDSTARDSLEKSTLSDIVSVFGEKYNIYSGWNSISGNGLNRFRKETVKSGRYFLIPIFQSQIEQAKLNQINDTTFSYLGSENNSFVFIINGGENSIEKLNSQENGLMVFKPSEIEGKYLLLLTKSPKDFQHRARRVFEFTIEGKITDAVNLKNISEKNLKESFGLAD